MFAGQIVYIAVYIKIAEFSRKLCLCFADNMLFVHAKKVLQGRNCNDFHIKALCKLEKSFLTHHRAVICHNLAAKSAFFKSRKPAKVNGCLSMTVAHKNAPLSRDKGEHVAGAAEVLGAGSLVYTGPGSNAAFNGTDSRCSRNMVYAHGKGSPVVISIQGNHRAKSQLSGPFFTHRHADKAFCMGRHHIYIFCRSKFCRADHVTFIFAVFVVRHQNDFA